MLKKYLPLIIATLVISCTTQQKQKIFLRVPSISMKTGKPPKKPGKRKRITVKWCSGEKSYAKQKEGNQGFIDEVVAKATHKHQAQYVRNAKFFWSGSKCIILKGIGEKI